MKSATEAFTKEGQKYGIAALNEAIGAYYLTTSKSAEAVMVKAPMLAQAKKIGKGDDDFKVASMKGSADAQKLLTELSTAASSPDSLAKAKQVLEVFKKAKDKAGEAYALNIVANSHLVGGNSKQALRAAKEAYSILKESGNKDAMVPILKTLLGANAVKRCVDDALKAATELAKVARDLGNKKSQGYALDSEARAFLAIGQPGMAVQSAEEAVEVFKGAGDKEGQASALSTISEVHKVMGKPTSALNVAKDALTLVKGIKGAEAAAMLVVADASPSSNDSLVMATSAVAMFKELGDKSGEAAALILAGIAHISQPQPQISEGVAAAQEAVAICKEKGDKSTEAVAQGVVAFAHSTKQDPQLAEAAANLSLQLFRDAKDDIGISYANDLLSNARFSGLQQSHARLLFDTETSVAHIELNEMATQESLENCITTLNRWHSRGKGMDMKAICLHIEGMPGPPKLQSYAMKSGAFLIGLRSIGMPIVCCVWGTVAGPTWGLVFASDYRITTQDTTFMLPIWGPPECLGDLCGLSTAAQLCINHGPMPAYALMELAVVNTVQTGRDIAEKSASEYAKRLAAFPHIAIRQTIVLMNPAVERYATQTSQSIPAVHHDS